MILRRITTLVSALALLASTGAPSAADLEKKKAAVASVEKQQADMTRMSDQVWQYAETALRETRSSKLLADYAEKQGFTVQRGVAGMPTAFIASYGQGKPVIAILGEYDALPGISQKVSTTRQALEEGAPGHGCGHNLFGVASLAAAVAVKDLIAAGRLKGTLRFYGTPAEEAIGGKIYMIREGLFKDVDTVLVWHPADKTHADTDGFQANIQFFVEFHGRTAHAAADPWNGRSAVDAMELFSHGVNMMREHVKPTVRIHYVFQKGGDVPNVVPDYARIWMWIRDSHREGVDEVFARVQEAAKGAAMMAGVTETLTVQTGYTDENILESGAKLVHGNLAWLEALTYTPEEQEFARGLQRSTGKEPVGMDAKLKPLTPIAPDPPGGSSDVGDVSWVAPTIHFYVATAPKDVPWHAWTVVASGGMSIGHKGMMLASKTLAATAVDLFEDAATRDALRAEFNAKTKGHTYKWYVPDGPPPVPKQ